MPSIIELENNYKLGQKLIEIKYVNMYIHYIS